METPLPINTKSETGYSPAYRTEFNEEKIIHLLHHYLPSQAPLKDFIHHNTLHAFQQYPFHLGLNQASQIFGYVVYLQPSEYRQKFREGKISPAILERVIQEKFGKAAVNTWLTKMLHQEHQNEIHARVGRLRKKWSTLCQVNMDKEVHPLLFRLAGNYLDQGISIQKFPVLDRGFLSSIRELERHSFTSFFHSKRVRKLLLHTQCKLTHLLKILVGDETLYHHYLLDQQFAHPGWSGLVAVVEQHPESLFDKRNITLRDFIALELLFEIDVLDRKFGKEWPPLGVRLNQNLPYPFSEVEYTEAAMISQIWQEAFEWSYYDQVLRGLQLAVNPENKKVDVPLQAVFCIDDRECSIRRYVEEMVPGAQTFGTAGFFNVEFYFQPSDGKFHTKVCPAPLQPGFLVKEQSAGNKHRRDVHFSSHSKGLFSGWAISQTMGFWSAVKMAVGIFFPGDSPARVSSFRHMDKEGKLEYECTPGNEMANSLQPGFTVEQMADRVEGLLKSIGLTRNFAPLVYLIGHGASSVNNTHYAGYDCGACSGRAGSVNARVAASMANHPEVRSLLELRGIHIPESTVFLGGLHDTTRDEMEFYDETSMDETHLRMHAAHREKFTGALSLNARERSRRFLLTRTDKSPQQVHDEVKLRSVSLFETRPEWNHATNALCIVGRRESNQHLFLDRRSFLNSYDYREDPDGKYLLGILRAVVPVCGGINLEYYFSRTDNQRLGAGTKLPHNVMGLLSVTNGMDGDLRTGLPWQMVNIHDPVRLMVVVEQSPGVILQVIESHPPTMEWIQNEWVHLAAIHPETRQLFIYTAGEFREYFPLVVEIPFEPDLQKLFEQECDNIPVCIIKK